MIDFFDKLGDTLNDMIGAHENNNVGYAITQMYASGGYVEDKGGISDPQEGLSLASMLRDTAKAAQGTIVSNTGDPALGGRLSPYSSPVFLTGHITNSWGNFFHGPQANPGGTNSPPQKTPSSKPIQSEQPTDFYARWYNRMREFAQAEEVVNRGQSQVRTK